MITIFHKFVVGDFMDDVNRIIKTLPYHVFGKINSANFFFFLKTVSKV